MAAGEPIHKLIIHFKGNQYLVKDVSSDSYSHLKMLSDVSELALKDVPGHVDMYITLNLPIPGSSQTVELQNDTDMKRLFILYKKIENIHVLLKVSKSPPLETTTPQPEKLVKGKDLEFIESGHGAEWIPSNEIIVNKKRNANESYLEDKKGFPRKTVKETCKDTKISRKRLRDDYISRPSYTLIDLNLPPPPEHFENDGSFIRPSELLRNNRKILIYQVPPQKIYNFPRATVNIVKAATPAGAHLQPLEPPQQKEQEQQLEPQSEEVKSDKDESESDDWAMF